MRLRMLKLSVGKGRQIIKQLFMQNANTTYTLQSAPRSARVCALQSFGLDLDDRIKLDFVLDYKLDLMIDFHIADT